MRQDLWDTPEVAGGQESLQTSKPEGDARGWKTELGSTPYNEQST